MEREKRRTWFVGHSHHLRRVRAIAQRSLGSHRLVSPAQPGRSVLVRVRKHHHRRWKTKTTTLSSSLLSGDVKQVVPGFALHSKWLRESMRFSPKMLPLSLHQSPHIIFPWNRLVITQVRISWCSVLLLSTTQVQFVACKMEKIIIIREAKQLTFKRIWLMLKPVGKKNNELQKEQEHYSLTAIKTWRLKGLVLGKGKRNEKDENTSQDFCSYRTNKQTKVILLRMKFQNGEKS